jgi:hypothetical protein
MNPGFFVSMVSMACVMVMLCFCGAALHVVVDGVLMGNAIGVGVLGVAYQKFRRHSSLNGTLEME